MCLSERAAEFNLQSVSWLTGTVLTVSSNQCRAENRRRRGPISIANCAYTSEAQPPVQLDNRAAASSVTNRRQCDEHGNSGAPFNLIRYCRLSQAAAGDMLVIQSF